jgi:N-methylhydantoinase B
MGFPSGVAGVPAEVIETLAPIVQHHRYLRTDSGGPGQQRGGLGQATAFSSRGEGPWSVSAMIDRTRFTAQGLEGGQPGALGEFYADAGRTLLPKTVVWFEPTTVAHLNPPGGGGYGNPLARDPQAVLNDVVNEYVSIAAAERDYGVVVRYTGDEQQLVRLPEHYTIDWPATGRIRGIDSA